MIDQTDFTSLQQVYEAEKEPRGIVSPARSAKYALNNGHIEIFKYFVENTEYSEVVSKSLPEVYRLACHLGKIDIAEYVESRCELSMDEILIGYRSAMISGHLPMVKHLEDTHGVVAERDLNPVLVIPFVIKRNAASFPEIFARFSEDSKKRSSRGCISVAASSGNFEILQTLVKDHDEASLAFQRIIETDNTTLLAKFITETPFQFDLTSERSKILISCIDENHRECLQVLLEQPGMIDAILENQDTLLSRVFRSGHEESVEILLQEIGFSNFSARLPHYLHKAVEANNVELLQLVLETYPRPEEDILSKLLIDAIRYRSEESTIYLIEEIDKPPKIPLELFMKHKNKLNDTLRFRYEVYAQADEFIRKTLRTLQETAPVSDEFIHSFRKQFFTETPLRKMFELDLHESLSFEQLRQHVRGDAVSAPPKSRL